jgi:hypothetical protein
MTSPDVFTTGLTRRPADRPYRNRSGKAGHTGPAGTPTRGQDQNAEPDKIKCCAVHPGSANGPNVMGSSARRRAVGSAHSPIEISRCSAANHASASPLVRNVAGPECRTRSGPMYDLIPLAR